MKPISRILGLFVGMLFHLQPAVATVLEVRGRVSTIVQELRAGEPGSVTSDQSEIGVDAAELPISAGASLQTTDFESRVVAIGQGLCELAPPDLQATDGPRELSAEVAGYSDGESVTYLVTGSVVEERRLLFAGSGNATTDPDVSFNADGSREIESQITISGAVVVWSLTAASDLQDVQCELEIAVRRDEEAAPLFRAEASLSVPTDAEPSMQIVGPLRVQRLNVDDLTALGLDEASAAILRDVAETGQLAVFLFERQTHAYRYTVRRDEAFTLKAELNARIRNAPGSTGVAATLGRPFSELADFIGRAMPGVDGIQLEKAINKAIATGDRSDPSAAESAVTRNRPVCGTFGAEALVAGLLLLAFAPRFGNRPLQT